LRITSNIKKKSYCLRSPRYLFLPRLRSPIIFCLPNRQMEGMKNLMVAMNQNNKKVWVLSRTPPSSNRLLYKCRCINIKTSRSNKSSSKPFCQFNSMIHKAYTNIPCSKLNNRCSNFCCSSRSNNTSIAKSPSLTTFHSDKSPLAVFGITQRINECPTHKCNKISK
jgi:hypothetical protein